MHFVSANCSLAPPCFPSLRPPGASAWLRLLKILARTRTNLDRTLFAPEFVLYLVRNIESHVQASTIASSPSSSPGAPILSDCVRLLLNMCIINRRLVHQVFLGSLVPEPQDEEEADELKYAEPPPPSPLCSLVSLLPDVRNTAADPEIQFYFVRILMFVTVEPKLARGAIKHAQLYQNLIKTMLQCAEEAKLTEEESSSSAAASASSSSASAAAPSSGSASTAEPRKVVMETLRVLANLSVLQDDALPSLASVVQAAEPALYESYLRRMAAILATGVEIPPECKEGYKGIPEVTAAVEAAQKQAAIDRAARDAEAAAAAAAEANAPANASASASAQDPPSVSAAPAAGAANAGADAPRPTTPTSVAASTSTTSTSVASPAASDAGAAAGTGAAAGAGAGSAPAAAAAASAPLAQFAPLQREQTRIILALMDREAAESAAAPNANAATLLQIQQDIANTLNSPESALAMLPYLEADGCKAFHSLIQILHRALVWIAKDPAARRKEGEQNLSPILTVLSKLIKLSPVLRNHAKRSIFMELADPPSSNADGTPFRKADASNYAMTPAGSLNDKNLDPDPLCLKVLLIGWIITLNFNLKQIVSEFLYRVCGEDSQ